MPELVTSFNMKKTPLVSVSLVWTGLLQREVEPVAPPSCWIGNAG